MPRPFLLAAFLASAPAGAQETPTSPVPELSPSAPVELALGPRGDHTFTLPLEAGRTYAIEVEQLDTVLELSWSAPGHQRRVNDRTGRTGREELFWVADASGTATLVVRNLGARPGRGRVTLAAPREATSADRERHRAEMDATSREMPVRRAAADRFAALGLVHRRVRVLDRMAYLGVGVGEFALARQAAEECVSVARAAPLPEELSSCLCALANVAEKTGDLDRATETYEEAIAMREARGDPGPLSAALGDSANVLVLRGDYVAADERRRRALDLARESGEEMAEAVHQMGLGAVSAFRGETEAAVAAYESGRMVARRLGNRQVEAIATVNAGVSYGNLGDIERSLARMREAAALAEEAGLKPTLAMARLGLGAEHDDAGDLEAAERELRAGVALAREIQDPLQLASGEGLLGWVLARRGDGAGAEAHLSAALASARESGARSEEGAALMFQGKARIRSGKLAEAEEPLLRAQALFEQMGRSDNRGQVAVALAQLALARGTLDPASERIEEAIAHFESTRTRVALADQRARYLAFRREAYDVALAILMERERREPGRGHRERAFALTERARARSLQEEINARRAEAAAAPPALAERSRRALDRIGHLQRELVQAHTAPTPDRGALDRLERELSAAVAEEEAARREIRLLSPRAARADELPVTAEERARWLRPDEALLEYHVGAEASWLFVITTAGLEVRPLPGERALRAQVDELRRLLGTPRTLGAAAYAATAHRLFETLVAPAVAGRPQLRRLRIVPDGPLWEMPFEALVTTRGRGTRYLDLPYVVRRFTVSYQPSAASPEVRRSGTDERPQMIAFADPRLPDADRAPASVARVERAVFREGDRWSLAPLPCARQEARDAAAWWGDARASVHVGEGARESRVKSDPDVARVRYLLFATHALVSETMPSQSALVLSLEGDGAEDGLLQAHEIDALKLEADLVVLSACETALGQNVRGEGLLGLARAFFHAGARRLLASLWRVADCSTALLSTELFRRLQSAPGEPDLAEALRRAKLRLLEQPRYAHPYHWAPFVLVG